MNISMNRFNVDLENYKIPLYIMLILFSKVANPGESPGNRYNIQLINALVMHVGTSAIQFIRSKGNYRY